MDIKKIKKLIELLESGDLSELELKEGEESIRIKSRHEPVRQDPVYHQHAEQAPSAPLSLIHSISEPAPIDGFVVNSPMVGTFYQAASPESPPFVQIGQTIELGDTLCVIEAMKMLNHIKSEKRGVLVDVLVDNAQPIEFGQPLFVIKE